MSKNKKIFISVLIIVLLIILLVIFSPKLVKRLTGSVAGAQKEVKNEQVNEVCNKDITSDYFITLSGKIIQDFGEEGMATITIKNDNLVFTKEIEVNSNEFNKFNYVLPRGNYDLTVTKDGYKTFESEISDTNDIEIVLNSNSMSEIIASSRTYYNTYYDYYSDGTLHIKAVGDFASSTVSNDDFIYSVLADALYKYLRNNGIYVKSSGDYEPGMGTIESLLAASASVTVADVEVNGTRGRDTFRKAYAKIESGECTASNINDSNCDDVRSLYENFGVKDFQNGKKTLELIINMPVPTNLIIDENVSYIPNLAGVVADEVEIGSRVFLVEPATFMYSKIGTLKINSSIFNSTPYFAAVSKINNLMIGDKVSIIPEGAFVQSQIDNISISNSVVNIKKSAFEDAKFNGFILPNNLETIEESAFKNTGLETISFPESLTSIGDYAFRDNNLSSVTIPINVSKIGYKSFYNNPIEQVTILGEATRFNDSWANIGFPESLKPSN